MGTSGEVPTGEIWTSAQNGQVEGQALTRREFEVARLIADGLTNRDIGLRLVISERTAETHLEHIRAKLGIRSRAQVAAWIVTRNLAAHAAPSGPPIEPETDHGSEHRIVTCLFADVTLSDALILRLGPERTRIFVDDALQDLQGIAAAEGAVVERSTGGSYFAMFGAPVAHADDPARALRAAEGAIGWARSHPDTAVRVGVESGQVLLDIATMGTAGQPLAFGDPIGAARRLRDEASSGEVRIGPICRDAALLATARLPFIGRRRELALLTAAFERAAASREAILALLVGPPGQGKTRTAEEFIATLTGRALVLKARCRPGAELGGRTPLRQILSDDLGQVTLAAIGDRMAGSFDDRGRRARIAGAVGHSAGIIVDQLLIGLGPTERVSALTNAWRAYLGAIGNDRPVVVWIDDIHWADPELVHLIDRITSGGGIRLLVVATARSEFVDSRVRPGPDRVRIDLGPLDDDDATALASSAGANHARAVLRGEGNPLFVIELARSRAGAEDEIPTTLQAAIGARLDELPSDARELLQLASVAGEVFDVGGAALLAAREHPDVANELQRLVRLRYLRSAGGTFRFHHPLVHEVAYRRLTMTDRMRLHSRFASDPSYQGDPAVLAHHWWAALGPPDAEWFWEDSPAVDEMRRAAIDAHIAAGQLSADQGWHDRAVGLLEHAIALSKSHVDIARSEHALANAYWRASLGDQAWTHRLRAIEAYGSAGELAPPSMYADALELTMFQWGYFRSLPQMGDVRRLSDEALDAARRSTDSVSLTRVLVQRAFLLSEAVAMDEASAIIHAAADARPHTDALQRVALVQLQSGEIHQALQTYRRVDDLVAQGGQVTEVEMVWWRGITAYLAGDLAEVGRLSERLTRLAIDRSAHVRSHALALRSYLLFARGEWEELVAVGGEIADLVTTDRQTAFCLAPAGGAAYGTVADTVRRRKSPLPLADLVQRMIPESAAVRDSTLLLPVAMAGGEMETLSRAAFGTGPVWDRQVTDPLGLNLAMALVVRQQWSELERALLRIDRAAARGSDLAAALSTAARAEKGDARRDLGHQHLRSLGYLGVSQVLSFRP